MSTAYLKSKQTIFWDFDGVIKDSVEVKSDAFEKLFLPFGVEISKKVKKHHEDNGGMSRFDKLPIYIKWSNNKPTQEVVDEYADKFSALVKQKVIDSEWVLGVLEYLNNNYNNQDFFLVTATPQQEIEEIIKILKIEYLFKEIVGSPIKKFNAIMYLLKKHSLSSKNSIMVGDSFSDYSAARINNLQFVLKCNKLNVKLQQELNCQMIENFYE
jgi:phosphoglycolate phosphatase-like HAD superfamily hydrolase